MPMKLSVIIVNYNVEYFLEQCLHSVFKALQGIESEVWVVDNHSADGSVAMVKEKFPRVKLIANNHNPGFAKANNQALRQATGEYVLLLNPDTVVEENTFSTALHFMDSHPDAGGLGIKMIDGKGRYLPESKRGLPTPSTALYKILGLTALFPRSPVFARYYLGHLSANENQQVEILAGAFMLLRSSALQKTGLLDEDYFMYGEDIDLSYRILQAGYKNYYLADSQIIHYKGESTKKGSLNYVLIFYKAMVIFARKHFSSSYARIFNVFIYLAIFLRAAISVMRRLLRRIAPVVIDAALALGGLFYITDYWEKNHRFVRGGEYDMDILIIAFPIYTALWLGGVALNNGYQRPARIAHILQGVVAGSIAILVGYSLLNESYRFSRAIIIMGSFFTAVSLPAWRYAVAKLFNIPLLELQESDKRILIVGTFAEAQRVHHLIQQAGAPLAYTGYVTLSSPNGEKGRHHAGQVNQLPDLVSVFNIDEVIFCSADMSSAQIFKWMSALAGQAPEIKIAPPESQFIIGSNSIQNQGSWYAVQLSTIARPANRRRKRLLDLGLALGCLLIMVLIAPWQKSARQFFRNTLAVLRGKATWVGYNTAVSIEHLPHLKPGILHCTQGMNAQQLDKHLIAQLNDLYAKDYKAATDMQLWLKNWRALGSPSPNNQH